jgi:uncharacterized membrane protein YfcA
MTETQAMFLAQIIGLFLLAMFLLYWYRPKGNSKRRPPRHERKRSARNNGHAA